MAKPKKKAAPKAAAKPRKSAGAAPAAAKPARKGRAWIVPLIMVAVLLGVGAQIYMRARYLASLHFDMERSSRIVPQGRDQGQAFAVAAVVGDKDDNTYVLEDDGSVTRLQRFDAQLSPQTLVYKAARPDQALVNGLDMDVAADGTVYVLLKDGRVVILDRQLGYKGQFKTGAQGPSAVTVDGKGRVFVASGMDNRVLYFNAAGVKEGEFGAPGTDSGNLAAPFRIRATADDDLVVIERTDTGMRGKIFSASLGLKKTFLVDKIQTCEPIKLGVNSLGKAFLNDHMGSEGIRVWDASNGKLVGSSQATKDGQKFINPGAVGANRYTPAVYVHTVVGLIKCYLPTGESQD